jgi:hypothetical protein
MIAQTAPKTRAECKGGPRRCPWIFCSHHLYTSRSGSGWQYQKRPLEELSETCVLDVVDKHPGGIILDDVAELLGFGSRERARQLQEMAKLKIALKWGTPEQQAEARKKLCPNCHKMKFSSVPGLCPRCRGRKRRKEQK